MVLSQPDLFFSLPCILLDIFLNSQLSCYDQGFKLQLHLFFWLLMMHLCSHCNLRCGGCRITWYSLQFWILVTKITVYEKRKGSLLNLESWIIVLLIFSISGSQYLNFIDLLRNAIRDMVVRGAPAIAIAAALSLAVEVFNLDNFNGSPGDAASFLQKKLEYLVSRYILLPALPRQQFTYFGWSKLCHCLVNKLHFGMLKCLLNQLRLLSWSSFQAWLLIWFFPSFFSRPTAVNLSDAATKLKEVASKAAATTSEARSVFQVLLRFIIDLW